MVSGGDKTEIKKELEKRQLLALSEVSIIIDTYDDLFSDFDPRPYDKRTVSEDLVAECQRAVRNKASGVELKFLIPHGQQNTSVEQMVKKRLKQHFRTQHDLISREIQALVRQGGLFVSIGIILMVVATLVLFNHATPTLLSSFFIVALEPAGWFFFWEGLHLIIFDTKRQRSMLTYYLRLSNAEITFNPY